MNLRFKSGGFYVGGLVVDGASYRLFFQILFKLGDCLLDFFELLLEEFSVEMMNFSSNFITLLLHCYGFLMKLGFGFVFFKYHDLILSENVLNNFFSFGHFFVV